MRGKRGEFEPETAEPGRSLKWTPPALWRLSLLFLPSGVRRLRDLFRAPINLLGFNPKRHAMIRLFLSDSDLIIKAPTSSGSNLSGTR
jgi:hypothetical protein